MRAAVTERVGTMAVVDRPDPDDPGPGEVVVHPEAVGICGSDYHFFAAELSDAAGDWQFPRVPRRRECGRVGLGTGPPHAYAPRPTAAYSRSSPPDN